MLLTEGVAGRLRGGPCSCQKVIPVHSVHSAWVPRTAVPNRDLAGQEKGSRVLWTNSNVVTVNGGRKIVENQWAGHRNGVCYCLAIAGSCHVVQLGQCARDDAQVAASWKVDRTTDFWEPSVLLLRAWSCAGSQTCWLSPRVRNLSYSPETPNLGQIRRFLEPCDLEIWPMTLQNNRAPLLCYFKLCASFCSHWWIKTWVIIRKRPIWVKFNDFSAVWPWNLMDDLEKQ